MTSKTLSSFSFESVSTAFPAAGPRAEHTFAGPRDLQSAGYREFLTSRYGLERNEIVGKYIFDRRPFDNLDQVLQAAHAHELALCAQSAPAPEPSAPASASPVAVFDPAIGVARVYPSWSDARLLPK